ncbi:105aa long hypothetical protein [Pyrococcus horikoshii OT3]|uniref:Uncharacterized protein n=1 Tax=Pyrococcus horikoshii (strain ATCC 700860 / DSM 12428 / JCM 9974 / NBRC 100139 / OT-3) TaxID=70601 RepID=O58809_PYRHO|nr:105aa long hypothetical protein [Pyrococcus horikoshii OT3]
MLSSIKGLNISSNGARNSMFIRKLSLSVCSRNMTFPLGFKTLIISLMAFFGFGIVQKTKDEITKSKKSLGKGRSSASALKNFTLIPSCLAFSLATLSISSLPSIA